MTAWDKLNDAMREYIQEKRQAFQAAAPETAIFELEAIGPDVIDALSRAVDEVFDDDKLFSHAVIFSKISDDPTLIDAKRLKRFDT